MKYSMGFIVALGVDEMVKAHWLMLASWQNGISPSDFLRNVNFHVISTTK